MCDMRMTSQTVRMTKPKQVSELRGTLQPQSGVTAICCLTSDCSHGAKIFMHLHILFAMSVTCFCVSRGVVSPQESVAESVHTTTNRSDEVK